VRGGLSFHKRGLKQPAAFAVLAGALVLAPGVEEEGEADRILTAVRRFSRFALVQGSAQMRSVGKVS
jgi:hypothetical protein